MLLDSCVIIDLLRGSPAAVEYFSRLAEKPSLSAVTITELVGGCRTIKERRQVEKVVENCHVMAIDQTVASLAGEYIQRYRKSHRLDPVDSLIAATAKSNDLQLITHNIKHFPMFEGLKRPFAT